MTAAYSRYGSDGKPYKPIEINVCEDLPTQTELAFRTIQRANRRNASIFRDLNGGLVRLEPGPRGRLLRKAFTNDRIIRLLAEESYCFYYVDGGEKKEVQPPRTLAQNVSATPAPPVPVLRGIVGHPFFDQDGNLVNQHGYHAPSQTYCELPEDLLEVDGASIDANRAVKLLLKVFGDFPFGDDASRAHLLAALLQPMAREMIAGRTPAYVLGKSTPGTGATLTANSIGDLLNANLR